MSNKQRNKKSEKVPEMLSNFITSNLYRKVTLAYAVYVIVLVTSSTNFCENIYRKITNV